MNTFVLTDWYDWCMVCNAYTLYVGSAGQFCACCRREWGYENGTCRDAHVSSSSMLWKALAHEDEYM